MDAASTGQWRNGPGAAFSEHPAPDRPGRGRTRPARNRFGSGGPRPRLGGGPTRPRPGRTPWSEPKLGRAAGPDRRYLALPATHRRVRPDARPQAWNPALGPVDELAGDARHRPARRRARLRPPLGVGPPVRDLWRPVPADLRGLVDPGRAGPWRPRRTRLGLLVGANTFRNPGLVAKTAATLDHISDGRAILGIGGAWMEPEHTAHGIDFGSGFGERLDWLDESVAAIRPLLDGQSVTSAPGGRYHVQRPAPPARCRSRPTCRS